jgi:ubiquinone/menaquinone biosynthesis C-methylase UbiE
MNELERDLARFYDQQAPERETTAVPTERELDRAVLAARMKAEDRSTLLEVGAGAGHDGAALRHEGFTVVALDLSTASSNLCQAKGLFALVASARDLPFHDDSFDAAFAMNTMLHMPDVVLHTAMEEMVRVVPPASPLGIGLWGGVDLETTHRDDRFEPRRRYWYRSDESLRNLLAPHGVIEHFRTWEGSIDDLHYQFCIIRTPAQR